MPTADQLLAPHHTAHAPRMSADAPDRAGPDLRPLGAHIRRLARMAVAEHLSRAALLTPGPRWPAVLAPRPERDAALAHPGALS